MFKNEAEHQKTETDSTSYLNLPARSEQASGGEALAEYLSTLSQDARERAVASQILGGNVPAFCRELRPITLTQSIGDANYETTFFTACDYLAIGSDQDYLYMPMTPTLAQYLANRLDCTLPTKNLVDAIYSNANVKLSPQPIPPSDQMITVPIFADHTDSIRAQIARIGWQRTTVQLVAGHKKDIIISNKIYDPNRSFLPVVIYGWHYSVGNPIQPVYNGHVARYADYSHGVRLISNRVVVNGDTLLIEDILKDQQLAPLLSNEGVISRPYYPDTFVAN